MGKPPRRSHQLSLPFSKPAIDAQGLWLTEASVPHSHSSSFVSWDGTIAYPQIHQVPLKSQVCPSKCTSFMGCTRSNQDDLPCQEGEGRIMQKGLLVGRGFEIKFRQISALRGMLDREYNPLSQ